MKIKIYMHAERDYYNKKWDIIPRIHDMSDTAGFGHVVDIVEVEFDFNTPLESEMVKRAIVSMREVQGKIRAKAEIEVQNIEQQIQEMLCLPSEVTP